MWWHRGLWPHKETGGFYRPAWATELDSILSNKITKKIIIRSKWPTCFWNGFKWVFLCWQKSWAQALPLLQPPKVVGIRALLSLPEVCVWSTTRKASPADLRSAPRTHPYQGLTIACNPVPLGCLAHCTPVYTYVLTFIIKNKNGILRVSSLYRLPLSNFSKFPLLWFSAERLHG